MVPACASKSTTALYIAHLVGVLEACWPAGGDRVLSLAMTALGNGLSAVNKHEDALVVKEAELAMLRREAKEERRSSSKQYCARILGQLDRALSMQRDVYFGTLRVHGEEYGGTMLETNNYAGILGGLGRFEETKSLTCKRYRYRDAFSRCHHLTFRCGRFTRWRSGGTTAHARRSPRGRVDARGDDTDRAARARRRASDHDGDWGDLQNASRLTPAKCVSLIFRRLGGQAAVTHLGARPHSRTGPRAFIALAACKTLANSSGCHIAIHTDAAPQ